MMYTLHMSRLTRWREFPSEGTKWRYPSTAQGMTCIDERELTGQENPSQVEHARQHVREKRAAQLENSRDLLRVCPPIIFCVLISAGK